MYFCAVCVDKASKSMQETVCGAFCCNYHCKLLILKIYGSNKATCKPPSSILNAAQVLKGAPDKNTQTFLIGAVSFVKTKIAQKSKIKNRTLLSQ